MRMIAMSLRRHLCWTAMNNAVCMPRVGEVWNVPDSACAGRDAAEATVPRHITFEQARNTLHSLCLTVMPLAGHSSHSAW